MRRPVIGRRRLSRTRPRSPLSLRDKPANALACWTFSRQGLAAARNLAERLRLNPWLAPEGVDVRELRLFAPARLCSQEALADRKAAQPPADLTPCAFAGFAAALARRFRSFRGHLIIGAAGIAVRALAPLLRHKSQDAPVVVLDAAGHFAISLLCGHWGGGNGLARHAASLLGGQAVITTASDMAPQAVPALDCLARKAGLRILDWGELPLLASALLEGRALALYDPLNCLPEAKEPHFRRVAARENAAKPLASIHWQKAEPEPGLLRLAAPCLHVGLGLRRNVEAKAIEAAVLDTLARHGLEEAALADLATVAEKAAEPGLAQAVASLGLPLLAFPAPQLAAVPVPHPSTAAGARFDQQPFSVCEAAALLAAAKPQARAVLVVPKTVFQGRITVAVALSATQ